MAAIRRRPLALAAAVAVALGAGALAVTSASAAEAPLKDYELTWGIKQSYRSYVTGMAAGSFTPPTGRRRRPATARSPSSAAAARTTPTPTPYGSASRAA